jgi:hypothetical protein
MIKLRHKDTRAVIDIAHELPEPALNELVVVLEGTPLRDYAYDILAQRFPNEQDDEEAMK